MLEKGNYGVVRHAEGRRRKEKRTGGGGGTWEYRLGDSLCIGVEP